MTVEYEERMPLIPRNASLLLTVLLAATAAFCIGLSLYDSDLMEVRWAAVIAAICVVGAAAGYVLRIDVRVEDGVITVRLVRKFTAPLEQVIDTKTGDIDVLRNYSGWGIKKVTFKTYAANGIDTAISIKFTGRRVLTFTTERTEELLPIVRSRIKEERGCRVPSIG